MIFFRKRLFVWLVRAYVKKWGKSILFFFILGLLLFYGLSRILSLLAPKIPIGSKEAIGMVGAYTLPTLPKLVLAELSRGLTAVDETGRVIPDIAEAWDIRDDGKTYVFTLKPNLNYSDQTALSSSSIDAHFADVSVERPNSQTIVFKLKDAYSPFLLTLSRPIFKQGFVGVGEYKIRSIALNGDFVESLTLTHTKNPYRIKTYHFYPSQESLKLAFVLGEINSAVGLLDIQFRNTLLSSFTNAKVVRHVRYSQLVALFFNTKDTLGSNSKLRSALSYGIPDTFEQGVRNSTPYPPMLWVSEAAPQLERNTNRAKELVKESLVATKSGKLTLVVKALPKYRNVAELVAQSWGAIGVETRLEIVESVPEQFQVFLGDFKVSQDPDQYILWHKNQESNITRYSNLRIDKLLEDGRRVSDQSERRRIYAEFQKYLLSDSPAIFLFFPYEYTVSRR